MTDERDDSVSAPEPSATTQPPPAGEGVRIIGAEEARAAIEGGQVQPRLGNEQLRFGDVPPRPAEPQGRTVRFPLPDDVIADRPAATTPPPPEAARVSTPAAPAQPATGAPAQPAPGAPAQPATGAPAQPATGAPARPASANPTAPAAQTTAATAATTPARRAAPEPPREIVIDDDVPTGPSVASPTASTTPSPASSPAAATSARAASQAGLNAAGAGSAGASSTVRVVRPATPPDTETSGQVELQHWTEAPTGEVPRILPEAELAEEPEEAIFEFDETDENAEAWAALGSAPRFRESDADWEEEDFAAAGGELKDDSMNVGALANPIDDDAEFEREVAARRRGTRRGAAGRSGTGRRGVRRGGAATTTAATTATAPTAAAPATGAAPGAASAASTATPTTNTAAAAATPSSGRNLPTAIATGVGIALVAVASMLLGPAWVCALAVVIVAIATLECFEGLRRAGNQPATLLALLGAAALLVAAYNRGTAAYPVVMALVVFFTMLWYLAEVVRARPVPAIGSTLLGFCYVGLFGSFAGLLLAMPWQTTANLGSDDGVGLILGLALCAVGSDVVAYFVGSRFGKTRIAPRISPHKTLEGLAAGWIASVLLAVVVVHLFDPWSGSWAATLALGAVVGVIAPLGDLIESMIKRDLGVKDFGTLLPGHGGVMDRFDGILVCLPAVYFLARIFFG